MEDNFSLESKEHFRINPHVWLQTLLAIAGDKTRKAKVVQTVARQTGCTPKQVEIIMANTIKALIDQTRAN